MKIPRLLAMPARTALLAALLLSSQATVPELQAGKKPPLDYTVEKLRQPNGDTEYRLFHLGHHFASVIQADGAYALRPHPGDDPNSWGTTLYLEAFFAGEGLSGAKIKIKAGPDGVAIEASGAIRSRGRDFGKWKNDLFLSDDRTAKKVSGVGGFSITLKDILSDETGDLNLLKIASNYLDDVPLLSGGFGDTGDTKGAEVFTANPDNPHFFWIPDVEPAHFPFDLTDSLDIAVLGELNQVDTLAQGYAPIAEAAKPSLRVRIESTTPGTPMIFGAIYDVAKGQDFWEDNVGITPLVIKHPPAPYVPAKKFEFAIEVESTSPE